MDRNSERSAVFIGLARDCSAAIPYVLSNISRISQLFAESAFVFFENDSKDPTKDAIQFWCKDKANAKLISLDGLSADFPIRTVRLENIRNQYLALLRSDFSRFDYAFIVDCDDVNAAEIDIDAIRRAVAFLEQSPNAAGVFANADGVYYDVWALRHPLRCPGDVWEEVCDYAITTQVTDEEAFKATLQKRIFTLPPDAEPLQVDSAFGGLGIYKIKSILKNGNRYLGQKIKDISPGKGNISGKKLGWQCCEHVAFNLGFRELGEQLFILPDLINVRTRGWSFPPSFWRTNLFEVRRNDLCPCGSGTRYKHCHGKYL